MTKCIYGSLHSSTTLNTHCSLFVVTYYSISKDPWQRSIGRLPSHGPAVVVVTLLFSFQPVVTISAPVPSWAQTINSPETSSCWLNHRKHSSDSPILHLQSWTFTQVNIFKRLNHNYSGWPDLYLGRIVLTRVLGWGTCSTAWCSIAFALHRGFPWQWHHHWVTSPSFSFPGLSSCQPSFQAGNFKLTGQPSVCW